MKFFCSSFIFLFLGLPLWAQTNATLPERPTIACLPFTRSTGDYTPEFAPAIQASIEEGFAKSGRYVLVERTRLDDLLKEIKTQEVLADSQVAQLGHIIGARYVVTGSIDNISASRVSGLEKPNVFLYTGHVAFSFHVVEVSSGKIILSTQLQAHSADAGAAINTAGKGLQIAGTLFEILAASNNNKNKTQETTGNVLTDAGRAAQIAAEATMPHSAGEAIQRTFKKVTEEVQRYIRSHLPVEAPFSAITKATKRGKALEVEVFGGKEAGLNVGDIGDIVVRTQRIIFDKPSVELRPIGRVKVRAVTGDYTALCEVKTGGQDLPNVIKTDSTKLEVIFMNKP